MLLHPPLSLSSLLITTSCTLSEAYENSSHRCHLDAFSGTDISLNVEQEIPINGLVSGVTQQRSVIYIYIFFLVRFYKEVLASIAYHTYVQDWATTWNLTMTRPLLQYEAVTHHLTTADITGSSPSPSAQPPFRA